MYTEMNRPNLCWLEECTATSLLGIATIVNFLKAEIGLCLKADHSR